MENLGDRLKQFIDFKGFSIRGFEQQIKASNGSLSSQIKENKSIGSERLENILNEFPDLNPNWLLTGKGEMLLSSENNFLNMVSEPQEKYGATTKKIPLLEKFAIAGTNYISEENSSLEMIDPGELFKEATLMMRVYGDSMEPRYPSGSYIPVKQMETKTLLVFGEDYVIQTKEYLILKRIQKSSKENSILACSINQETWNRGEMDGKLIHEPIDINFDDIITIGSVLGCITKNK